MTRLADLTRVGLRWHPSGQAGLTGPLLALADDCDRAFRRLARCWDATEERHPAALPARLLPDHLRSFPHQAVFPVSLDPTEANLAAFADGAPVAADGAATLTATAPVTGVLTPAACLHVYAGRRHQTLAGLRCVTTGNTCFRNEPRYRPLRRQWCFTMREIVCLGTPAETDQFLAVAREVIGQLAGLVDLPVEWTPATDAFFRPRRSPGYLLQRVQPSKHELTYRGGLALGSVNQHHDHFGAAFGITRDGATVTSACAAFGIERWLFALTDRHGTDPACWPDLTGAATKVVDAWRR